MAIFHWQLQIISRGQTNGKQSQRSVVAAAAYRSGEKLENERTGKISDYRHKPDITHSEIQLPKNAPEEFKEREKLWNSVELKEKRQDAQLAREVLVAIPKELTPEQQIKLVHDYVQKNFVDEGMVADWSIHNPQKDEKGNPKPANPHAHILLTMRSLRSNGSWAPKQRSIYKKDKNGQRVPQIDSKTGKQKRGKNGRRMWKRETKPTNNWNDRSNVEKWREAWAKECNQYLTPEHQIDHRSYKRQGKKKIPTIHEGYYARKLEREAPGSSWRVSINQIIKSINEELESLREQIRGIVRKVRSLEKERSKNDRPRSRVSEETPIQSQQKQFTEGKGKLGARVRSKASHTREQSPNTQQSGSTEGTQQQNVDGVRQQSFREATRRILQDFRLYAERQRKARQRQRRLSQSVLHHGAGERQYQERKRDLHEANRGFTARKQFLTERQNRVTKREGRARRALNQIAKSKVLERYNAHFHQAKAQSLHSREIDYPDQLLGHSRGRSR